MILCCEERDRPKILPSVQFWVVVSDDESARDILRLCGKIPKLKHRKTHDGSEWELTNISCTQPIPEDKSAWEVTCTYTPVIEIAPEPEERFQPYHGPRGRQPDGSFVLTPRCYKKLIEAAEWRGRTAIGCVMPTSMCEQEFVKLVNLIQEDCGIEFGILS